MGAPAGAGVVEKFSSSAGEYSEPLVPLASVSLQATIVGIFNWNPFF